MTRRSHLVASGVLVAASLLCGSAWGQDTIFTDRPTVSASSLTVEKGRFQLETGLDADRTSASSTLTLPTKLRYGVFEGGGLLFEGVEIALESSIFGFDSESSELAASTVSGGVKYMLVRDALDLVTLSLLGSYTADFDGADSTTSLLLADISLGSGLGLTVNFGASISASEIESFDYLTSLCLAKSGLGYESLGVFVEVATYYSLSIDHFPSDSLDYGNSLVDGGFTYALGALLQLDVYLRLSLDEPTSDLGGGLGLSFKI